jgi:thiamine-phosphate pyrophosphorylase
MKWAPQGLERLMQWKRRIGRLPLVAIGGLTPDRAYGVRAAGADSLAVITDIFAHPDPQARISKWLVWAERCRP